MFLKIALLVAVVAIVWFGFRYLERRDRVTAGKRGTGERTLGERLRKSMRAKDADQPRGGDVEDTERCPTCQAFVSVEGISDCGKPNCPY